MPLFLIVYEKSTLICDYINILINKFGGNKMKEIVLNVFTSVMMVIVVSALCSGVTYLRKYIDGTLERLKNDERFKDNAFAQNSFYFAENFIAGLTRTAVAAMEQAKAKDLRQKVAEGLVSRDKLQALALEVRESVKAQLSPVMIEEVNKYILDLDSYIDDKIEASVLELKRSDTK